MGTLRLATVKADPSVTSFTGGWQAISCPYGHLTWIVEGPAAGANFQVFTGSLVVLAGLVKVFSHAVHLLECIRVRFDL